MIPAKECRVTLKGPGYDPVIFCHHDRDTKWQGSISMNYSRGVCPGGVVTRIATASTFYKADACHQQFYEKMGTCYSVLDPVNRVMLSNIHNPGVNDLVSGRLPIPFISPLFLI